MTEDTIEQIKRNLSLERIISHSASDWSDESGGDRVGRCTHPEHGHTSDNSNAGNLIVTEDDMWYCHSHGTGGDVLDWIAIEEGYATCQSAQVTGDAFVEVLKEAADRANVELDFTPQPEDYEEAAESSSLTDVEKAQYALDEAVDILHDNLTKTIDGMTVRRIVRENRPFGDDVIDDLRIGYIDGEAYGELLRRLSEDALKDIGFMNDDGRQHGTGRIIYPYYTDGMPSFWAGRATENSEIDAKYLKPHASSTIFDEPVFEYGTQGASVGDGVWITEGIQDAVAMNQHGSVYAVSPVAKDTSTRQRNQIIERAQKEGRAVICFDADEGGQGGAVSLALDLMSAGVQTEILPLPDGTDPCDYFMDGGEFENLEPVPAAKRVIEVKGDTDPLIKRLLDTASTGTPRGERLVDSISEVTPIRKEVLRDMMAEEREYEDQHGWREPEAVRKTKGADPSFTFVYPDGTEIEMDSIGSRTAAAKFTDKFGAEFNFFPDISRSDLLEMVNRWMAEDQIELEEVDPLTPEGRTREKVQEKIQSASAVPDKDDLSAVGEGYVAYTEDESEILVVSDMVEDWVGELDISLRKASEYLAPVKSSNTRRLRVDGARKTFWVFDAEAIDENGYRLPEPKGLPGEDEAEEVEEL